MNISYRIWKFFIGPRTLSRDLGYAILFLFLILLLVVGALTFVFELASERTKRDAFAREKTATLARLSAEPLLAEDEEELARIARVFLESNHIVSVLFKTPDRNYSFVDADSPGARFSVNQAVKGPPGEPAAGSVQVVFRAEPVHELRWRLLLYGLFVGAVALLIAVSGTVYLMGRILRRPLYQVLEGLRHYARGDYDFRLKIPSQRDVAVLVRGVNDMARSVQRREIELRNSETRYRSLVDSARHMTFTLNDEGIIVNMNRAVRSLLGVREEEIVGKRLSSFIYEAGDYSDLIRRELFRQKFAEIIENKGNVRFKIELRTAQHEPRELELSLEYLDVRAEDGGKQEAILLGRAYAIPEDSLAKFLVSEVRTYEIGNFLTIAEQLTHRVTAGLERYCSMDEATTIRMGLREMLVNAIEHGNLNISFDEKTEATTGDDYFGFLAARQKDPRYRDRKVSLRYSMNPERVRIMIADEGEGFAHDAISQEDPGDRLYHGRGIMLTKSIFDKVQYNERGNRVLLVKYFQKPQ